MVTQSMNYLKKLKERKVSSRVYRKYQLEGLEIAKMLDAYRTYTLLLEAARTNTPGYSPEASMMRFYGKVETVRIIGEYRTAVPREVRSKLKYQGLENFKLG